MNKNIATSGRARQQCCRDLCTLLDHRFFKALGDPSRVGLVLRLARLGRPCSVSEIAACCPTDLSVVSRHLAALREAGILESEKRGKAVIYRVRYSQVATMLRAMADTIDGCCPPPSDEQKGKPFMTTETHDQVRERVSKAYAEAVSNDAQGCCCNQPVQKGVLVKLAGYDERELAELPQDAVINAFGCGNPLTLEKLSEGDVVLDLGSGAGIDILLAAKRVGPTGRAIGVDMTDEMIARARKNAADAGLTNVDVRKGIIEELPVESASVDWAISNCVINLSPDKPRVFAEIARVLKPGGRMLVSDVIVDDLPEFLRTSETFHAACISGAISEKEYLAGLRDAGLVDIEVRQRLEYDTDQLVGLIKSDCSGAESDRSFVDGRTLREVAEALTGKISSAMIYARKPLG